MMDTRREGIAYLAYMEIYGGKINATVEEIAKAIYTDWNKGKDENGNYIEWEELPHYRKDTYRSWVRDKIVSVCRLGG